jgi:hypothetical protein
MYELVSDSHTNLHVLTIILNEVYKMRYCMYVQHRTTYSAKVLGPTLINILRTHYLRITQNILKLKIYIGIRFIRILADFSHIHRI